MNKLYYGDCLTVMQREVKANSVNLIYLDLSFNSNHNYNTIYIDEEDYPIGGFITRKMIERLQKQTFWTFVGREVLLKLENSLTRVYKSCL